MCSCPCASRAGFEPLASPAKAPCLWLEHLRLSDFRNYETLNLELDARPVVLTGANGAGKTNLLEAVSLLTPGRGLGRAQFGDMVRHGATNGWAVNASLHCATGEVNIGTGFATSHETPARSVRIDGVTRRGAGALGEYVRAVWLTPAMDGLFTGPAGDRRRFLDRLIASLDPGYRSLISRFERAMRQRNRLLENGEMPHAQLEGLETQMAESGVAIAAARLDAVARLGQIARHTEEVETSSVFPWASLALEGFLEERLQRQAAIDAEDAYRAALAHGRERDRAARRTLEGPHRSDFLVGHGPKSAPARSCSTGEQKALLIGLVLAQARLVKQHSDGAAPLILLDEIAAHLDAEHRAGLFAEIIALKAQAWMSGTDAGQFAPLGSEAQLLSVENGCVTA